jgi:predicted ATP-grasp superfamily ATP-dependent carboligase
MSVVVTNARNRIAYNVVRSLGQKGITVHTADFVPYSMAFASRYSSGHFVYPSPFSEPEGFVRCMLEEVQRRKATVLIPVYEETFLIAKHIERFRPHVSMVVPDYSQILIAHNKDRWEQIARRLSIPVPASYPVNELQRSEAAVHGLGYPVLVKPKQGGGAWGIRETTSPTELGQWLADDHWTGKPWEQFFVQQKIAGPTHCVAMLFNRGRLRAKVTYQQLRDYPATGGQATLRVSIHSPKAEQLLERLLENLGWHGPCQADFIIDSQDGTPYLIDINPRLWGSLAQAIASGVDFPDLIYRIATEGDVEPLTSFKVGVVTRWLGGDLAALPSRVRDSDHKLQIVKDFIFPATPAALYDDLSLTDPLPFFTWGLDALYRALRFRSLKAVSHESLDGVWE